MRTNLRWTLWVGCSAMATAATADTTNQLRLQEIVVIAQRAPSEWASAPASVWKLDAESLMVERSVRSFPETLATVPSVLLQKTAHGQGSPFLRGFTGFRNVLLVDGIRLNHTAFREGPNQYWATVDPLSLDRIEVMLGPGSVLYGSDAIGGTVQAFTVDPPRDVADLHGRAYYRASSAEQSHMVRLEAGHRPDEAVGWIVGVTRRDLGDLEGGRAVGRQSHTGYDEWGLDGKLDLQFSDRANLILGHQSFRQNDVWRTHRTIYGIEWKGLQHGTDRELFYDQARDLTWARLILDEPTDSIWRLSATVYRQWQGEDEYRVKEDLSRSRQGFDVVTWGGSLEMETGNEVFRWMYGVDAVRDGVDSYAHKLADDGTVRARAVQGPVADDATYDLVGAYLRWIFGADPRRNLEDSLPFGCDAAVRYTRASLSADRVVHPVTGELMTMEDAWDTWVGSARASLALDEGRRLHVYGGVVQGFRAPNLSDLTRFDIARSGEQEVPAEALDPEKYISAEVGLRWADSRARAQLAAYRTWLDGMIVRAPTGRITPDGWVEVTKKNAGDGWIHGIEAWGEWTFLPCWTFRGLGAWMDGEVEGYPTSAAERVREPISRLLPPTGELALRFQPGRWWIEGAVRAAAKADQLSASDRRDTQRIPPGGTPGWAIASLRAGVQLARGVRATAAVENITDEDYRIHGSGVNEPGRNFVFSLDARF